MAAQTKAKVLAPIKTPGMPGFLLWMRRDNPRAYKKLLTDIPSIGIFEEQLQNYVDPAALVPGMSGIRFDKPPLERDQDNWFLDPAQVLGDLSDVFSSIGSTIADTASSVGSWLGNNAASLLTAGASVALVAKQSQLAQSQLQLAQAGRAPMQTAVAYTAQGQPYYVPVQQSGMATPFPSLLPAQSYPQTYRPASTFSSASTAPLGVPLWVWLAGVGGIALLWVLKRR